MLKKLHNVLFANNGILFFDELFGKVTFYANKMDIPCVDLDKIYLDDVNFDEDYCKAIIRIRVLAWRNKFEKHKAFEKNPSKELMPVVWHPIIWDAIKLTRRWKKEIGPIFIDKVG